MSTIRMPGFTGEASVYRTSRHHVMTEAPAQGGGAIRPAHFLDLPCYHACRLDCDCSDLTGANRGACLRGCNAECRTECTR
jgi:hypothetical protein